MKKYFIFSSITVFLACNAGKNKTSNNGDSVVYTSQNIPVDRSTVNPQPVKTYHETVKSFATTDEFKIELFETNKTFNYLIKMSYKNLNEEDTLHVPDFGIIPQVELKAGNTRPSCIAGFLDQDKKFRESKLIFFEDDAIKVHVLAHYGVFSK